LDVGVRNPENDFSNRNATFMTWNLMHMVLMLKSAGDQPMETSVLSEMRALGLIILILNTVKIIG